MENKLERKVKLFRLISGEDLIALMVGNTDTTIIVEDVATVGFVPSRVQSAAPQVGIMPWVPYRDMTKQVHLVAHHIFSVLDPQQQLEEEYKKLFSKVLTPATPSLILKPN
jgi:hypothetical protein